MERSREGLIESDDETLEEVNRKIDELVEKRHMLAKDNLHVDAIPELAEELDKIDHELMQLRIKQEYLKGEIE